MPKGFRKSDGKTTGNLAWAGSMRPDLAPVGEKPTLKDIYWAAGIYEGEGCCANTGRSELAQVDQKDPFILYKLRDFFGGSVGKYKNSRTDTIMSRWQIFGPRARGFLQTIYVLLSPRRQEQIRKYMKIGEYNID